VALKRPPHSPAEFRFLGTVLNQAAFYTALGVKDSDKMYLPPDRRVAIWKFVGAESCRPTGEGCTWRRDRSPAAANRVIDPIGAPWR
jgi:hypothetical protein